MGIFVTNEQQLKILNEASKKEVEYDIKDNSESLFIHLLKLYYWGYDTNVKQHWIKEISNKYCRIKKLPNNKYPSKDYIEKLIWKDNDLDYIASKLNKNKNYKSYPRINKIDYNTRRFCSDYIEWISEKLSLEGTMNNTEAQHYLSDLYNKYRS